MDFPFPPRDESLDARIANLRAEVEALEAEAARLLRLAAFQDRQLACRLGVCAHAKGKRRGSRWGETLTAAIAALKLGPVP